MINAKISYAAGDLYICVPSFITTINPCFLEYLTESGEYLYIEASGFCWILSYIGGRKPRIQGHHMGKENMGWISNWLVFAIYVYPLPTYEFGHFNIANDGPLVRYVKLRVAYAPGMQGTFSASPISNETAS